MIVYLDHETELIARGKLAPPIVCTSWTWDDQDEIPVELWQNTPIHDLLSAQQIVGANTTYDLTCEMAADPRLIPLVVQAYSDGRVRDVLLDRKLIGIAEGLISDENDYNESLEKLAAARGVEMDKDSWRLRYGALKGVPVKYWPQGAIDYSRGDTRETRIEHRVNEARIEPYRNAGIVVLGQHAALAAGAAWALHLASCWGVCTDKKRTLELEAKVSSHLDEIRAELVQAGLIRKSGTAAEQKAWNARLRAAGANKHAWDATGDGPPNGKRSDLAAAARMIHVMTEQGRRRSIQLADAGADELKARTKKGEDPTTVHEELINQVRRGRALVKLDRDAAILSGDELLIMRADYVTSTGLLGRVERMKEGFVLPLQTRFDSLKATYRTSSTQPSEKSGLVGEQMQNFPRGKKEDAYGLRECFTPRADDLIFIGADYGLAELHCLSQLCFKLFGYSRMGEMLNAGLDLHWEFAAISRGMTVEAVKALGTEQRDRAKPANFGFPGGMGPEKFVLYSRKGYGVQFKIEEVKPLKEKWLETYPEVRQYLKWVGDQAPTRESHITIVHPITGSVRGGMRYTAASNNGFQHLAAYAGKVALLEVTAACFTPGSPLFGWRLWNYVHDELLLEGPRSEASAAAKELARIMVDCFNRFTVTFPTHADAFVTRVWSKKVKAIVDPHTKEILEWVPKAA